MENVRSYLNYMKSHGKGLNTLPIYLKGVGYCLVDERFKKFKRRKKDNPRILGDDIYRYIANNSELGLNKYQVRECFQLYAKMLKELYESPYAEKDMTIILPRIGHFYLREWVGRKGGSTYRFFNRDVTLDKSEPSYFHVKFKFYKTLSESIRNKTKHYNE